MTESYVEFFDPSVDPSPPEKETDLTDADDKSVKENYALFKGRLDDVDSWIKHEEFRLKKLNEDSERELREDNARKAFWFSSIWAILIGLIILLRSFFPNTFVMSENEYIATIGTLSVTILTYYLLVVKYLFARNNSK